jgi:hypothetical protein
MVKVLPDSFLKAAKVGQFGLLKRLTGNFTEKSIWGGGKT